MFSNPQNNLIVENLNTKWVSTGRCTLQEVVPSSEDFLDSLCKKSNNFTRHHYVAKMQNDFLKTLKNNLTNIDFAENCSYIVQDEIQGLH